MQDEDILGSDFVAQKTIKINGLDYDISEDVTFQEALAFLHRSASYLYKKVHFNQIPYKKYGSRLEFRLMDLVIYKNKETKYMKSP